MIKNLIAVAFSLGLLVSCQPAVNSAAEPLGKPEIFPTAAMLGAPCDETDSFAVQVFSVLAATCEDNFVFSPASLEAVLRLLQQGARGTTAAELAALPMGRIGGASAMSVVEANALFVSNHLTLNPGVKADEVLKVPFATAPDEAASIINIWARRRTQGLIPTVVSEQDISPYTTFVAANAIYLNEKWLHPFPASATRADVDFTLEDGGIASVAMMRSKAKYRYAEGEDWQAVALPYKSEKKKGEPGYFIGILPQKSASEFAKKLTPQHYRDICRALAAAEPREVIVCLPRFKVNPGTYSLKPALQAVGLRNMFTLQADFSGFSEMPLYLDNLLQRCYINADEEGTEAAAVTVSMGRYKAIAPGPRPEFIVFDKPYVWAIGELTTAVAPYFMGITQKP